MSARPPVVHTRRWFGPPERRQGHHGEHQKAGEWRQEPVAGAVAPAGADDDDPGGRPQRVPCRIQWKGQWRPEGERMISTRSALVLAGGGVAGIAWETGFLLGLQDEAPGLVQRLLTRSTTLVGTSAGSTVAAQIATGSTLQRAFDRQVAASTTERNVTIDLAQFARHDDGRKKDATSPEQVRQRLGTLAREADTPPAAARRAVIEARLTTHEWSDWPLLDLCHRHEHRRAAGLRQHLGSEPGGCRGGELRRSGNLAAGRDRRDAVHGRRGEVIGQRGPCGRSSASPHPRPIVRRSHPSASRFPTRSCVPWICLRPHDQCGRRVAGRHGCQIRLIPESRISRSSRRPRLKAERLAAEVDTFWS